MIKNFSCYRLTRYWQLQMCMQAVQHSGWWSTGAVDMAPIHTAFHFLVEIMDTTRFFLTILAAIRTLRARRPQVVSS